MDARYSYPDTGDKMIGEYIGDTEPWPGCWEESEQWVLKTVRRHIGALRSAAKSLRLLDAGCGTGRLLLQFQDLFQEIVGIDPDKSRLAETKKNIGESGI